MYKTPTRQIKTECVVDKISSSICQYAMILYAANPDTVISPPIIISLGTITIFFNGMEVVIDLFIAREREHQHN